MGVTTFDSTSWMSNPAICDLASRRQWVCWSRKLRKGKETKIPYQPNGKPASTTDSRTWSEMPTCFTEVVAAKFDGIGYVLTDDDGVVCIDLDHCLSPATSHGLPADFPDKLESWASERMSLLVDTFEGFLKEILSLFSATRHLY